MFRIQHQNEDILRVQSDKERFASITNINDLIHKKDYDMNSILRKANRERKKADANMLKEGLSRGLNIPLQEPHPDDEETAKLIKFKKTVTEKYKTAEKIKMNELLSKPLFNYDNNNRDDNNSNKKRKSTDKDDKKNKSDCKVVNSVSSNKRKLQDKHIALTKQMRVKLDPSKFNILNNINDNNIETMNHIVVKKKSVENNPIKNALNMLSEY